MLSAVRDLRKECMGWLTVGMTHWQPWCRGIQHLFKEREGYIAPHKEWWAQTLVKAGVLDPEAVDGGVVRLSSLSLDQEDSSYLGLFRIRDATVLQDAVIKCDPWPDCHSTGEENSWYSSAWHSVTNNIEFFGNAVGGQFRIADDATATCCRKTMDTYSWWHTRAQGCHKFVLSSTCPLLTELDRKEKFVSMYESCLLKELRPNGSINESFAWQSTLSKYVSICCRDERARARSRRILRTVTTQTLCKSTGNCEKYKAILNLKKINRLFQSWHPYDHHFFHKIFETMPVIVAFRQYLADNVDVTMRAGNTESGNEVLERFGLRRQNMISGDNFFVKELLAARIMPTTPWELPPAQIMVPHRTLSCTWAVENSKKGGMQFGGQTYASIWELAARDPSACGKYKQEVFSRWPGLIERCCHCYMREFSDSPRNRGVLKVLLPEHGPSGLGLRLWNESKHIVHEWIEQLPMLLPPELLPRAVVVADVIIG
eukprot:gnl/TRDRNA2_/TRDRNA2_177384_c2_seq13.p1 gnl/TRDRNA2_/TRDRNA2_177384_c2~~gnl/TRDRNA2_/TRDRNA2_177384_c2_seq13.p1  ORF type:complete len:486 (+),score=11.08 gnl/TRDRNA2_/TRDRNA2_177384_c2_seq13:2-1459(+)